MKLSGLIDALIASGGSVEQVRAVVAAAEAAQETEAAERRAKAAAKKRRQRTRLSPNVPGTEGDERGHQGTYGDEPGQGIPPSSFPPDPPNNYPPAQSTHTHTAPEARAISVDWEPSAETLQAVTKLGVSAEDVLGETRRFRDKHLGDGTLSTDWDAKFRGWAEFGLTRRKSTRASAHAPRDSPAAKAPPSVFVAIGTPEWEAWDRVGRANGHPRGYPRHAQEGGHHGWRFPSRWPPGDRPKTSPERTPEPAS